MFSKSARFPPVKDEVPGPNTYSVEEKRSQIPITFSTIKRFDSPSGDKRSSEMAQYEPVSPLGKFHTPQKSRAEIAGLKDEVDDLRQQLREESVRKKAVLKDIELQTRQLQASEARMRVMESKLKELAQSKQVLASEKATSDKELLALRSKWDSAARKLDKIHETVSRAQTKIATAEKERKNAENRVEILTAELAKKGEVESKCIELTGQLALSTRQVEQLQNELKSAKDNFTDEAEKTSEETQGQLYSLACTISQLRAELDAEMNYSTSRKTELALLQVEKAKIETSLKEALVKHEEALAAWEETREGLEHKSGMAQAQLEAMRAEYDQFRNVRDSRLVLLQDEIHTLQEDIAQKDASVIEFEQKNRELEAAYDGIVNECESHVREIELLKEELKVRQIENRRLDERVHFLESAMDYLRGEMAEQKEELDELKLSSEKLHERLAQQGTDLQSAQASQKQLEESLKIANEKIELLEAALAQAKLDAELAIERSATTDGQLTNLHDQLNSARNCAEEAQRTAKEDLEAMHIELEAEAAKLSNCLEKLAEKEATHVALVSAHEALQKAHETVQIELEERVQQITASQATEGALLAKNQQLEAQNSDLEAKRAELEMQKADLETQLEGLSRELSISQQSVVDQRDMATHLETEIAQLKLATQEGDEKVAALEAQLLSSNTALNALTSCNESLVANVNELQENMTTLNSQLEALTAEQTNLQQSLQQAQDDKELTVKQSESQLQMLKEQSEGKIETLKSELNVALESALDLMSAKSELAEQHSTAVARISALEARAEENDQLQVRSMESQRGYVNQISDLRAEIRSLMDQMALAQQEHDKQVKVIEECYQGKLGTLEMQFKLQLEEKDEMAQSAREHLEAEQATHYKQMDSLHKSIAELKREMEAGLGEKDVEIEKLSVNVARLNSDLSSSRERMAAMESEHLESSQLKAAEIETIKTQLLSEQSAFEEEKSTLVSARMNLEAQLSQARESLAARDEELKSTRASLESVEQSRVSLSESMESLKLKMAEDAKAAEEMTESARTLGSRLSDANDALAEMQVEKHSAESALKALRDELAQYKTQLTETDSVLALTQTELDVVKKDLAREKKASEAHVKQIQGEKKQWMELAESQKSELEESFKLMKSAQDEVDSVRAQYEALKSRREDEEQEMNDLRVKKLSHEVRMMTAELNRQKTRVQTRETAIAAGKAREDKLQVNLDAQIEKCRDLQRQLADKDREAIIERGRARSTSKPTPVVKEVKEAPAEPAVNLDDFNDVNVQLALAKAEITRLQKQLEVEKSQIETLIAEQTKLTGHNNPKQKIQFTHRLMTENHELKLERANLLSQLEKKGVDSPLRKSVTRVAKPRTALGVITAPTHGTSALSSSSGTVVSAAPTHEVPLSKSLPNGLDVSENAENNASVQ